MYATSTHSKSVRGDMGTPVRLRRPHRRVPDAEGSFTYAAKRMDPSTFTLGL